MTEPPPPQRPTDASQNCRQGTRRNDRTTTTKNFREIEFGIIYCRYIAKVSASSATIPPTSAAAVLLISKFSEANISRKHKGKNKGKASKKFILTKLIFFPKRMMRILI